MAIRVVCACGKAIEVADHFAGKSGRCKACGSTMVIPTLLPPHGDLFEISGRAEDSPSSRSKALPVLACLAIFAIGGVLGVVVGHSMASRPKTENPAVVIPSPACEFDPFARAAKLTGMPGPEIRGKCLAVQGDLQGSKNAVSATTLAEVIAEVVEQIRRKTDQPMVIDPTLFLALCRVEMGKGRSLWHVADMVVDRF